MGDHNKLAHDLFIVHISMKALQSVLKTLLVEIERALMLSLMACNNAKVQVDLCYDGIIDFV